MNLNQSLNVKIINKSKNPLPEYKTPLSSGVDLMADIESPIILKPLEKALVPTGIYIEMPENIEAQIRPRSGLAVKHGISVLNTPGTIDADYRGEIKIILVNLSKEDFKIIPGMRIAQMVFAPVIRVTFVESNDISDTQRGVGGFGHTGVE